MGCLQKSQWHLKLDYPNLAYIQKQACLIFRQACFIDLIFQASPPTPPSASYSPIRVFSV